MGSTNMVDEAPVRKEEYAQEIPKLKEKVLTFASSHNRSDVILALLSLEDAYDNLANKLLPMTLFPEKLPAETTHAEQLALQNHVHLKKALVEGGLRFALEYGKRRMKTIDMMPAIEVGVSGEDPDAFLEKSIQNGRVGPADSWRVDRFRLLGYAEGSEIVIIEDAKDTPLEDIILDTLLWLEDIYRVSFFSTAMQRNLVLSKIQGKTGSYVYNATTPDPELIERVKESLILNHFDPSASAVTWSSDFQDASMDTILHTVDKGLGSKENQDAMQRENDEAYKGFTSFEGYSSSFKERFGYSVEEFKNVCQSLKDLARARPPHSIWYGAPNKLTSRIEKDTRIGKRSVRLILDSMIWDHNLPPFLFPMYRLESFFVFSLWRVMLAEASRLELHFADSVNNDVKGKAFERACRTLLSKHGFLVLPERLPVNGEYLPREVSMNLWGRVKNQTDIDVVGQKGRFILVLECKETKRPDVKMLKKVHFLEKCAEELSYKTKWMIEQYKSAKPTDTREKALPQLEVGKWVVPIVISTFVLGIEKF